MICRIRTVEVDSKFQSMCQWPYENHPYGCPNYGKKKGCPPKQKLLHDVLSTDLYVIFIQFNLRAHVSMLRKKHPDWSDKQLYCCLYWQGQARKSLNAEIARFKKTLPLHIVVLEPEAMGVNVTALMRDNVGIRLEWPPRRIVAKVAVAGIAKKETTI